LKIIMHVLSIYGLKFVFIACIENIEEMKRSSIRKKKMKTKYCRDKIMSCEFYDSLYEFIYSMKEKMSNSL
jgi:hypothetical protein